MAGKSTIGIGHLLTTKEKQTGQLITGIHWRSGITEAQAMELLKRDVGFAERAVKELITLPLSQPQFDALMSFISKPPVWW